MCYIKKTISVRTFVIWLINSSRHRKSFVRGYIHSLFVSKAITRSYLARSSLDTNNSEYNRVRYTFYDVNYIYSSFTNVLGQVLSFLVKQQLGNTTAFPSVLFTGPLNGRLFFSQSRLGKELKRLQNQGKSLYRGALQSQSPFLNSLQTLLYN